MLEMPAVSPSTTGWGVATGAGTGVLRNYLESTELHQHGYVSPQKQDMTYKTASTQTLQFQRTTKDSSEVGRFSSLPCVFLPYLRILPVFPIREKRERMRNVKPETTPSPIEGLGVTDLKLGLS